MDKHFAEMFIEKCKQQTEHKYSVTNREGVIIAATEQERVGVFNEAAYIMMRDGIDMMVVEPEQVNEYLGVKSGVELPVIHNDEVVGAIGMTGLPEEVKSVVIAVKMTVEAMLEYKLFREKNLKTNNEHESFYNLLLSDRTSKREQLEAMAKRLGYIPDAMRIAIVLTADTDETKVLAAVKEKDLFGNQDIAFINHENEVVIFRRLNEKPGMLLKSYRQDVEAYLKTLTKRLKQRGISCVFYTGTIQNNLNNYCFAYRHCTWMIDQQLTNGYFYDSLDGYIKNQMPILELKGIFQSILSVFDEGMMRNYVSTVSLLERNNYNLVASSKELYLHKNTLVFRLNKIRDFLNVNPIQNTCDRVFMDYLCYYMSEINKHNFS